MVTRDDRTEEQKATHTLAVVARDKFLSRWREAKGGASRMAWAVPKTWGQDGSIEHLEQWVRDRSDTANVHVVDLSKYRAPRGTTHLRIYVCGEGDPGSPQWRRREEREAAQTQPA